MKHDPLQIARPREPTTAEANLWRSLRNRRFAEFKFRRQQPIGAFVVDFYCSRPGLVIERDGDSHPGRGPQDMRRHEWLESTGLRVLRILNVDLYEDHDGVMDRIDRECQTRVASRGPSAWADGELTGKRMPETS